MVCALALVASLLGVTTAAAAPPARDREPWRPVVGGFFNNPWGDRAAKFRIERQIVEAIRHARKGSYIRIAVYSFDRMNVARALVDAHKRGVRVQVLHNDHQVTPAMKLLKQRLGTNRGKKSWDYTCKRGCRSVQGVLHDKIYLFTHTGGARNVVMTGSANLTLNATVHQFNDLLVQRRAPYLHRHLLKLFWELKRDRTAKPLYRHEEMRNYQLWVFPRVRTTHQNDPVLRILDKVTCRGARGRTGSDGRTKLRVSMHAWNGARGAYLARKLRYLHARGCDVRVMWSLAGAKTRHAIGQPTDRGRVPRRANGYNTDCDALQQVDKYSHQKYFTISGRYDGDRSASYVFTGSSNWTAQGVSGDEMILRASGAKLVKDWNSNFNFIWRNRARVVGGDSGFRPGAPDCPYSYRPAGPRRLSFSGEHWEAD
jgi:phosphatidylserine/phosphatidylglycerophosphate/cardiolipin synthase-like enzyme